MCDLYPFERHGYREEPAPQRQQQLPTDIRAFRNYVRGPQDSLTQNFVTFRCSWHDKDFLFSVVQHLKVWNVIEYWTALEPDMYFEATDEHGTALDAAVVLPSSCFITRTQRTVAHTPPDLLNKRSRECQSDVTVNPKSLHFESKPLQKSKPSPPNAPVQVAGCMSL